MIRLGAWVRRGQVGAKYHSVESIVAGDVITHCGRRMTDEPVGGAGLEVYSGPIGRAARPLFDDFCKRCAA